jgi:hypothetical protein
MMRFKNTYSGRSILQSFGTSEVQATLALQQVQLAPRESDPDAGATIVIIKAVQRAANQLGCPVVVNGRLDPATMACIRRASGPNWESESWLKITKDLLVLRDSGRNIPAAPRAYQAVDGVSFGSTGMLLVLGGIAFLAWKHTK